MFFQILLGSSLLIVCAVLHVAVIAYGIPLLAALGTRARSWRTPRRVAALLSLGTCILLVAHGVEIWLWAVSFHLTGAFENFPTSVYFATVTYTTLGYGDVVLGDALRLYASFAAITGLLTFGISTAFLFGLLTRIMPNVFEKS